MTCFKVYLLFALIYFVSAEKNSFENVTIHGYSSLIHKFKKNILSSNNLKDEIPKVIFDTIEIKGLIPVLYKDSIADINHLDELILIENGIEDIKPGALVNLPDIHLIKLMRNKLQIIRSGVFNRLNATDIDLKSNQISIIEETAFDDMPNLLNVRLTDNKISQWNKNWFANTPSLTSLPFQRNLIEEIPSEAFQNLRGVRKYGKIPLKLNLFFSNNKIKVIHPNAFKGIDEIDDLWLDNNLIEELPENLLKYVSVENLKLNNNKLTCIENKDLLLKADVNDIDANPFDCGCLENIKTWTKKNNKTVFYYYSDTNCYANRLQKKINDINVKLKDLKKTGANDDDVEMITGKV